jgi:hypothetical protein
MQTLTCKAEPLDQGGEIWASRHIPVISPPLRSSTTVIIDPSTSPKQSEPPWRPRPPLHLWMWPCMSSTSRTLTRSAGSPNASVGADQSQKQDLAYHLTEHLRLNGVYWGHTACYIMGTPDALDREEMINYVLRCWDDEAGELMTSLSVLARPALTIGTFGAHPGHDGHILGTLSGIQILVIQDALNRADTERITKCTLISPWSLITLRPTHTDIV